MPDPPLVIDIDTSQIDKFLLAFPVSGPKIVDREMRVWMDDATGYIQNKVIDRAPRNTGLFVGSVYTDIIAKPASLLEGYSIEGIVSSSDYEPKVWALEWGREPGGKLPPVEAIAQWVRRKGLAGTYNVKTRRRIGGKAKKQSEDMALAWAIAINIKRYGTKGVYMFTKAYEESLDYVHKKADEMIDHILNYWSTVG